MDSHLHVNERAGLGVEQKPALEPARRWTTPAELLQLVANDRPDSGPTATTGPLKEWFESLFGDASVRTQWFAQMLQVAFVGAITDRYIIGADLGEIADRILAA